MNSPAKDIADYLAGQGIGVLGTDMFIENTPMLPNDLVTVCDDGGYDPVTGADIFRPTVRIRVHGDPRKYEQTYARVQSIVLLLHGVGNMEVDDSSGGQGCRYLYILQAGDIVGLPKDENNRVGFHVRFRLMRTAL